MKTNIVRIGNSQGIRIPKILLRQCRLRGEVEMEVRGNRLVIHSPAKPRTGWEEAFRAMALSGDDALIDTGAVAETAWDRDEWRW